MKRLIAGVAAGVVVGAAGGATAATTFVVDTFQAVRPSVANQLGEPSRALYRPATPQAKQIHQVGGEDSVTATCPPGYEIKHWEPQNASGINIVQISISADLRSATMTADFVDDSDSIPYGAISIRGICYPDRP